MNEPIDDTKDTQHRAYIEKVIAMKLGVSTDAMKQTISSIIDLHPEVEFVIKNLDIHIEKCLDLAVGFVKEDLK